MGANNYLARGDGAKGQGALSDASISVNDVAYNLTPDSTVRIISGDISRIDADALITAINSKQWWSGNIDRVIMKKAEYHFHQQASECDLQDGKAIVAWGSQDETISGSFRNVVFVVDDLKRPLYEIVRTGLEAAADAGFKKVSLPTIRMGTMLGRVEKTTEEAVQEMIKGVEEFFNANANSSLKEVTFVVFADPEIKRALISALKTAAALSIKPTNVKEDLLNEGFRSPLTDAERIAAREEKLKKAGFSAEDIAEIKGRFPNLNVVPMTPVAGDDISGIVKDAVALKRSLDQEETRFAVVFKLNGDLVFVDEDDTLKRVCDAYLKAK